MWLSYSPEVKAVIRFLELLNVSVSRSTINEALQNHPDWPSLLCVSDSLHQWQVPNAAAKMEPYKIDELPTPFIAYLPNSTTPLTIVVEVNSDKVACYTGSYDKTIAQAREDFLKQWEGVYLIAETNEKSGEKNYRQNKQKAFLKQLLSLSLFTLLLTGSLYILYTATTAIAVYLQYSILLAGTIISTLLLWYEVDRNNPLLHKVCGGIAQGNCGAILTSKASTFLGLFSWSEAGLVYFAGGLLTLLFVPLFIAMPILSWLHILALPYIFFSIYYQWRIVKQWCVLCLCVQALLLAGGLNVWLNSNTLSFNNITLKDILIVAALYLLPTLIWYTIKPIVKKLQQAKDDKYQYLRLKFNSEVFEILLEKQKQITKPVDGLGIVLGNPDAQHEIVKVCNPYCNPCALAHPKLEKILEENPNVKARIIFNATNEETDYRAEVVKHLLAVQAAGNVEQTKQAVDDWYGAEKKDYKKYASQYPMNGELGQQDKKIEAMDKWCKQTGIQFTPTFFINGKQLPDNYTITDAGYFLL
jgi:thiol-disulfide isomerase/thioredoxin